MKQDPVGTVHCLLVDDLDENLLSLEALLRRDGLVCLKAKSGAEALELMLQYEFALALLDVQMPGMNGFELAELMRGTQRTQRVPIIFLTAGTDDRQRRFRGYEAGAVDFLHKPIEPDVLRSKAEVFFALYLQQQQLKITAEENARLLVESQQYAEALKAADRRKDEFLANMSHEIRTPMNAVVGLANILIQSSPLTPKQREYLATLQMSADALLNLINDLLDISKIESGNVELERVPFSLLNVVEDAIQLAQVRAREKGLRILLELGDAKLKRRHHLGDPTRLRQVLLNLCSNAIKFTEKGQVVLSLNFRSMDKGFDELMIAVRDTGIGIPPNKFDSIFDKFVQADSSITRKYGGTGLGLAITKTLTELMGGKIKVESSLGEGSTFTITLPLMLAVSEEEEEAMELNAPRPRVLLVEDHAPNVLVAQTFLEEFGYEVEVVSDGLAAVDRVKSERFATVLMDVQMPRMNGYDATRLIREEERVSGRRRQTIIGMTAHALIGDRERCIQAGMDDYITKPFRPEDLQQKLGVAAAS